MNEEDIKIGNKVSYSNWMTNKTITGEVVVIAKILDHMNTNLIGENIYYVSEGEGYVPVPVMCSDLYIK